MTKRQRQAVSFVFFALTMLFFMLYLRTIDFAQIKTLHVNWLFLSIATLLSLAFRYWGVFIWRTILKDLGSRKLPKFHILSAVYSRAWMGRYIPGSVTWIAGKIYLASSVGISKSRLSVASVLEAGIQITAITIVSLLFVGFDARTNVIPGELKLLLVAGATVLLFTLHPHIFNRIIRFLFRKIRKKEAYEELHVNKKAVARSFVLYSIGACIAGVSYFFMTKALDPSVGWNLFFYIAGAYNLAGVLGMATPFVPSGLGVRDGAQLLLLSVIFPREFALILTIFSRLWSVAVDVLFYLIAQGYHYGNKKISPSN